MADGPARRTRAERIARLRESHLYLCTDSRARGGDYDAFLADVLGGGVDVVQLREKGMEAQDELALLRRMAAAADAAGALTAVNDRADLAAVLGADVLHLGQGDLTPTQARAVVGPDVLIGRSTHDVTQGDEASADPDVDYYCTGPLWATPTKPGRPAAPRQVLAAALARDGHAGKPWFAIGGLDADRLDEVVAAGVTRAVVVRALTEATDPAGTARRLRARLVSAARPATMPATPPATLPA